jgi:hypothetical protein
MTTAEERTRAVLKTRAFLHELQRLNFRKAGTAQWVRDEAHHLLRHYPGAIDMEFAAKCVEFASKPRQGRKLF